MKRKWGDNRMSYWMKRAAVAAGTGFVAGAVVFCAFAMFEWWVGTPATGLDVAIGVGIGAALAGWNS